MSETDEPTGPHVLALDLGSTSLRAVVLDGDYTAVEVARRPVPLRRLEPTPATLDADQVVESVCACLDDLQTAGVLREISAVALKGK